MSKGIRKQIFFFFCVLCCTRMLFHHYVECATRKQPPCYHMEKHVGNHFEGVPFYGPRGVCTGPGSTSRMSGTKRRNSDSFLGSSRENLPSVRPESLENSHLSKFLRHVGREQPRRPHDEESSFGFQQVRPISSSIISQPSTGGRADGISSKFDRAIPVNIGPVSQYPPRAAQAMPFGYLSQTKSRDASAGPSIVSQAAADEGSRTGVKGSGILSSINATAGAYERSFSGVLSGFVPKSGAQISDSEFPNAPSGHGLASGGRQMTIFYGGQAHVFDNVHPNKADIIMSLAGSNGGSWSTTYAPKLGSNRSSGEHCMPNADNETGTINGYALSREPLGRSLVRVNPMNLPGSSDRIPTTTGIHQEIIVSKETKGSNQGADTRSKERQHL
ncbi:hypothetical protein Leryth_000345 [Lithospermum erythrorhizon]|nr:hypothetical protein Leryth_000345 [Lithospermum erythrorhizon]